MPLLTFQALHQTNDTNAGRVRIILDKHYSKHRELLKTQQPVYHSKRALQAGFQAQASCFWFLLYDVHRNQEQHESQERPSHFPLPIEPMYIGLKS